MRRIIPITIVFLLYLTFYVQAAPTTSDDIARFLTQLNVKFQRGEQGEYQFKLGFPDATPELFIVRAMPEYKLVYLAIDDIHRVASVGPRSEATFRKMAELNFKLAVGKLEWEPQSTKIRLSHTFAMEEGIDFASFKTMIQTLLTQVENVRQELNKAR